MGSGCFGGGGGGWDGYCLVEVGVGGDLKKCEGALC